MQDSITTLPSSPEEILFQVIIPGRARILKNSKQLFKNPRNGKLFPSKSERYKRWAIFAGMFVFRARPAKPITVPVNVKMLFYFKDHQHEADLSNLYQGIEDILQTEGVLQNDRLIYSHDGSRKVFDSGPERVEVFITRASTFPLQKV